MRLQHTSVVRMLLSYANDKCIKCQIMKQLCKEFFQQQKVQPLNKSSNNFLDRRISTCRTGTKFAMAKSTRQRLQVAGRWRVRWGLLAGAASSPQVSCECLTQGSERWPSPVHAWMGAWSSLGRSFRGTLVTPLAATTIKPSFTSENKIISVFI